MKLIPTCLLVAALFAAGCSGSDTPAQTAAPAASAAAAASASKTTIDACALFSSAEIAALAGNPVLNGRHYAGQEVCEWDTRSPDEVDVLLTVRMMGGIRAKVLCDDLGTTTGRETPLAGVGDRGFWKFASGSLFNSGDLEACSPKGFVAISMNGKADEARLKQAATTLAQQTFGKM
jgi:hypothetical protein